MTTNSDTTMSAPMRRIGVVGAGVVGPGVVQALAQTGHDVVLVDVSHAALMRAERDLRRGVRSHHLVAGTGDRLNVDQILGRITFTSEYDALSDAEFVIESTTENWSVKRAVFGQLDDICTEACPLASNTSAIPITKIASATRRPERVVGIHFMNPVPLKPVVEVVSGRHTSERTLSLTVELLKTMKKEAVMVGDSPGFVSNRVLMLTVNESAFLVQEQVASAHDVDDIFKRCFGHPMGPLETADLIGLDTVLRTLEVLHEELTDSKFRPCPLLESMVQAGNLGRKSGAGFHDYSTSRHPGFSSAD